MLEFRLKELDNLCHNSRSMEKLLGEAIMRRLHSLQSSLYYIHHLNDPDPGSLVHFQKEANDKFKDFEAAIQKEIEETV